VSFEHRPSPARVTEAAAAKLPRWMLGVLLVAYITPGLFGRDPWGLEDAAAFGTMWTLAQGTASDWLLPNVAGEAMTDKGPLPFWVGAALILLFGPLFGEIAAARLTTVLWFALAVASLWYATYRLARRDEAQPVALAFGGEASVRDYGRVVADIAVLLMVATLGIALRMHEMVAETALFAWSAALLLTLVWAHEQPWRGSVAVALVLGAIALTRGLAPATTLTLGTLAFIALTGPQRWLRVIVVAVIAVGIALAWPLAAFLVVGDAAGPYFTSWWTVNRAQFGPGVDNVVWLGRNAGWYLWPLWPFALWTMYSWRAFLRRPHLRLPLWLAAAALAGLLLADTPSDRELIAVVPAVVVLAALGVPTLRRTADDAIDWFSIAMFSLVLLAVWAYFIAWHSGTPPRMAASVERIVPGLTPQIPVVATLIALAATALWLLLAGWRMRIRPPMLWRGAFLAAGGVTVTWVVAVSLFYEPIDYNRSYAPTARVLGAQGQRVAGDGCVLAHHLPDGTRAMFAYYGDIRFQRDPLNACNVAIHRDSQRSQLDDSPPLGDWQLAYETTRRARYDEVFRIWIRRSL
jgi:4-amino-4-deoxy-L-arabinose transferase-like glycosyltransferase